MTFETFKRPRRRSKAPAEPCPSGELHAEGQPSGYLAWHNWVEQMSATHDQQQCPDCKLWVIWSPKEPA